MQNENVYYVIVRNTELMRNDYWNRGIWWWTNDEFDDRRSESLYNLYAIYFTSKQIKLTVILVINKL